MEALNTYCYVGIKSNIGYQEGDQIYTLDPKDVVHLNDSNGKSQQ